MAGLAPAIHEKRKAGNDPGLFSFRHCERSEAIQLSCNKQAGLLRRKCSSQ
jgi:hypothetical protein